MKTTILTIITIITLSFTPTDKQYGYCAGWDDGYCEGWKDVRGVFAICPITPICPIPEINRERYKDGYNRGFKAGYRDASRK
jgi:hypothetical protein|tara:strand:- start:29 stop:274 length:246 start_codon:yes stop_codon:yes gene_type:complete